MFLKNIIHIPNSFNTIIFKKKKTNLFIFYNLKKKIKLPINWSYIFDKNTNTIQINKFSADMYWTKITNQLNKNFFIFENTYFEKIKFKGKGFRLRFKKKLKVLKFMFGHSHINIFFFNKIEIKRIGKYKYIFKKKNSQKLKEISKIICSIKPINIYTKRGIRNSKQIIYKRKGKKSTYV